MAYQPRQTYDGRSPVMTHEARNPSWGRQDYPPYHHESAYTQEIPNLMYPESEDSDVSVAENEYGSTPFPIPLSSAPSKQMLESQEAVTSHLADMERVENHNIQKHNVLKAKRARMDDRILKKRAAQDAKIKAIMDARVRRDSRVKQRRDREDIAFQRFYDLLEEEETRLRKRLKALKRGLPAEDGTTGSRRVSTTSMSPPGPSYSTVPPPAKRHQTSHPNQPDPHIPPRGQEPSPHAGPLRQEPTPHHAPTHHQPSYQFYSLPPTTPLPPSSTLSSHPHPQQPPQQPPQHPPHHREHSYSMPEPRRESDPPGLPNGSTTSSVSERSPWQTAPPPPRDELSGSRYPPASYDTRPPPPATSGFATVNHAQSSGFAAVNSHAATPPAPHQAPLKEHGHKQHKAIQHTPSRGSADDERGGNGSASKRTPSTTHPYQMSEAFANRHHHCEDTDSLNRGIWTWYGAGGTQDRPTAPATRMYLKCNHEACGRIDWRTVHGLQCHIVKNHEQPKGTIGSLEKALTAYGVPVAEIEEYERRHGLGSGGTMADPKNTKTKPKRESAGIASPAVVPSQPINRPPQQLPLHTSMNTEHSAVNTGQPQPTIVHDISSSTVSRGPRTQSEEDHAKPATGFAAVNNGWQGVNANPLKRPTSREDEAPRQIAPSHAQVDGPSNSGAPFWQTWKAANQPTAPSASKPDWGRRPPPPDIAPPEPEKSLKRSEPIDYLRALPQQASESGAVETPKVTVGANQGSATETHEGSKRDGDVPMTNDTAEPHKDREPDTVMHDADADAGSDRTESTEDEEDSPVIEERRLTNGGSTKPDIAVPRTETPERRSQSRQGPASEEKPAKIIAPSPDISARRVLPPRRESRRTSVATAVSRAGTDKAKEEDAENVSVTNTASKAGSAGADDDNDSIIVNVEAIKADEREREKEREEEKVKPGTPARRAPNGRFSKKSR